MAIIFDLLFLVNQKLAMTPDETVHYKIAANHQAGHGYSVFDPNRNAYYPTVFHGSLSSSSEAQKTLREDYNIYKGLNIVP